MTLPAELTPVGVYIFAGILALAAFGVTAWIARIGFGLDAMSVREDEEAGTALGVPATRIKVIAFVASAVLPALAGGLVAWNRSYIDPPSMFDPTIDLQTVVFVLFGGIGTVWGPFLGTLVLMIVGEEFLVYFPNLELALFGLVIILTVLVFPGGIVSLANRFGLLRRPIVLAPAALPEGAPPPARRHGLEGVPVLEVRDLTVRFGGLVALDRVSFAIGAGETVSIIGANGAGKTTLFNTITGFIEPTFRRDPVHGPLGRKAAGVPARAAWHGAQLPDPARDGRDDACGRTWCSRRGTAIRGIARWTTPPG